MSQVIELTVRYRLLTDTDASLVLESVQHEGIFLSVLHERHGLEPICYDFMGRDRCQFNVRVGESLTVIARRQGRIIGCLVNEVNTAESSRVLLNPRGGYNLIIYQSKQPDELPLPEDQHAAFGVRLLHEPTPTTACLDDPVNATTAYYHDLRVPAILQHVLPVLAETIKANEESHSREQLIQFCVILDTLGISQEPQIRVAFDTAMAVRP